MVPESFDRDWSVSKDGDPGAARWVTLPDDAMLRETRDPACRNSFNTGFHPGGVYRYTKTFHAPASWRGGVVSLEFEGVYCRSTVVLNGVIVGGRPSGYAAFSVRLDAHLKFGSDNTIEVVIDNAAEPNSRWYTGSGIYRPVHLHVGGQLHIAAGWPRVSTIELDGEDALVEVATEVRNVGAGARRFVAAVTIRDPSGVARAVSEADGDVLAGTSTVVTRVVRIEGAALWSPETPVLHRADVSVAEEGGGVVDRAMSDFGVRTITADARHGLRLNGRSLKLRGACVHHDLGVIGAHSLDAAEDRRIRILKEAGFNAIRSAHNPAARSTLRACDRHGVLVMDELTDVWWRPKTIHGYSDEFRDWWERDLESLIHSDFNHPSVIMYSIGNEIAETATPQGIDLNRQMAERARELDPTRLITNCINGFLNLITPMDDEKVAEKAARAKSSGRAGSERLIQVLNYFMGVLTKSLKYLVRLPAVDHRTRDAFDAVDVAGYNYMIDRYRMDASKYPERVIVGSGNSAKQMVKTWQLIAELPQVIGDFVWTGWDYIGEAGIAVTLYDERRTLFAGWPGLLAGEPVIDITGFRLTQSYVNEIVWGLRSAPHLAVQPVDRAGQKRSTSSFGPTDSLRSWTWPRCEGRTATVEVYADASRVDLLLDDALVGSAPAGPTVEYLATFSVPYQPGTLTAVAYGRLGEEIGRDSLTTAGPDLQLRAQPEVDSLRADGADLAFVPIELTDSQGTLQVTEDRSVTVTVDGAGTLLGLGSAEAITEEGFASISHRTYRGRALAVIRAGHAEGDVELTIATEGGAPVQLVIPVRDQSHSG